MIFFRDKIWVEELDNGSVTLHFSEGAKHYKPCLDFQKALALFDQFSQRYTVAFFDETTQIDWFPPIQYFLFYKIFWPYVIYEKVLEQILNDKVRVTFNKKGRVYVLYTLFRRKTKLRLVYQGMLYALERMLVYLHNCYVAKDRANMLFRYDKNDFRIPDLIAYVKQNFDYVETVGGGIQTVVKQYWDSNSFFVIISRYCSMGGSDLEQVALNTAHSLIAQSQKQYALYRKILSKKPKATCLLGVDDPLYLFPLILAAHRSGLKTIGFQHGLYGKNHIGYAVKHARQFEWFQWLVVWDDFWKKVFLGNNRFFPADKVISGVQSKKYDFTLKPNPNNRKILCMYERFLDISEYMLYLKTIIAKGFTIVLKLRPGTCHTELRLEYPFTEQEISAVELVETLDQSILDGVAIIAGVKTSLLYDMLFLDRPLWIFHSSYHYLDEVMQIPKVKVVKPEDLNNIDDIYQQSLLISSSYKVSSDVSTVEEALMKIKE